MQRVQAYFKDENDAESVRAKLKTINVEDGMIERVPEGRNITDVVRDLFSGEDHNGHDPHVLEFNVSDDEHDTANSIVKENNGYIR